jgi:hypothetical protein
VTLGGAGRELTSGIDVALPLSYGPHHGGPTGFEPATYGSQSDNRMSISSHRILGGAGREVISDV